ncbi:MAG TPA: hypothetical protein VGM59_08700 [Dongiaceae bacterium]|jgi:hypothetical protein
MPTNKTQKPAAGKQSDNSKNPKPSALHEDDLKAVTGGLAATGGAGIIDDTGCLSRH